MPKVTVILTSFNHAKYIREAIESALNQTYGDFELIIWDDASTDESWDIINSYSDPRIRVFRNERTMRAMFGINKCIAELASGEYIAIHNSDDIWETEKLARQVEFLDAERSAIADLYKNNALDDEARRRIERELDIDTEGQLIASVLSKKIAAGATHVVIDIPVGPTAKVRSIEAAQHLADRLTETAAQFGLVLRCIFSDGNQPVGRGIGPALEAQDVLAVLRCDEDAPMDLRERAASVAGVVLELAGTVAEGDGMRLALETIDSGCAWEKFQRICAAQGGLRQPPVAEYVEPLIAAHAGRVVHIDNRKLARLAKLAGAPQSLAAGISIQVRLGDEVARGQTLLLLHAQTQGELAYALGYANEVGEIVRVAQ